MDIKALLEERVSIAADINKLTETVGKENRSFTGEELERFDKMDSDFKAVNEKIETAKRLQRSRELQLGNKDDVQRTDRVVTSYKPQTITRYDQDCAFKAWALQNAGKGNLISRTQREAAERCGMGLNNDTLNVLLASNPNDIERAQSSSTNAEGGYLQNDGVFQGLERNMKYFGGSRNYAKVIRTENGEPLSWGYSDDTANVGSWQGQNVSSSNTSVTYSKKTIGEFTAVTAVYPVSVQLLQDARIDISADVGAVLGERLGRLTNTAYTVGSGAGQPKGFLTDATSSGVSVASATAFTYAELTSFHFSMNKAYRDMPSTHYTCSDATLASMWKITDSTTGRPLFWNSLSTLADANGGLTLFGKPIVINNDMPDIASSAKSLVFMVGEKFVIRDVLQAQIVALRERYMDQLAVGFIAYLRTDCKLLNAGTCLYLQNHS